MSRGYWRIQGRGPGDPDPSPLFLVQTENKFLDTSSPPPPYVRVWMTPTPLSLGLCWIHFLVPLPIHKRLLQSYKEDLYNTFYQGELTIIFFLAIFAGIALKRFFSSFNPIRNSKRIPDYFRNSILCEQRFLSCMPFSVYEVWRHFTTTTKILFNFPFIFKFGNPSKV